MPSDIFWTVSHDSAGTITYAAAEVWYKDITELSTTMNFTVAFTAGFVAGAQSPPPPPRPGAL